MNKHVHGKKNFFHFEETSKLANAMHCAEDNQSILLQRFDCYLLERHLLRFESCKKIMRGFLNSPPYGFCKPLCDVS